MFSNVTETMPTSWKGEEQLLAVWWGGAVSSKPQLACRPSARLPCCLAACRMLERYASHTARSLNAKPRESNGRVRLFGQASFHSSAARSVVVARPYHSLSCSTLDWKFVSSSNKMSKRRNANPVRELFSFNILTEESACLVTGCNKKMRVSNVIWTGLIISHEFQDQSYSLRRYFILTVIYTYVQWKKTTCIT